MYVKCPRSVSGNINTVPGASNHISGKFIRDIRSVLNKYLVIFFYNTELYLIINCLYFGCTSNILQLPRDVSKIGQSSSNKNEIYESSLKKST